MNFFFGLFFAAVWLGLPLESLEELRRNLTIGYSYCTISLVIILNDLLNIVVRVPLHQRTHSVGYIIHIVFKRNVCFYFFNKRRKLYFSISTHNRRSFT